MALRRLLWLLLFVDSFGYALVLPLLPLAARNRGGGTLAIGLLFATYSGCQLLAAPFLGRLSDRRGRRPVLAASFAGSAIGFAMMLGGGYWLLLLSRLVDGASAGNVLVLNAILLDAHPREEWPRRLAVLASATGAGIVAGIGASAILARWGLGTVAIVATILSAACVALVLWRIPETAIGHGVAPPAPRWRSLLARSRSLRSGVPAAWAASAFQSAFLLALPLFLFRLAGMREVPATEVIAGLVGVGAAVQLLVAAPLLERFGGRSVTVIGFAIAGAGAVALALASAAPAAIAAGAVVMVGAALVGPAVTAVVAEGSRGLDEGEVMGMNQSSASAGQMAGPILSYGALGAFGIPGYAGVCAALALGGILLTLGGAAKR